MVEKGQRIRHEDGSARALDGTRRDQDQGARRQRASERCRGEEHEAGREDPLGAETIAQGARRQDEGGKGDGVGADYPLQLADAAAQRRADAAQGGVDDGDIELHHAIAEAHRGKRQCGAARRLRAFLRVYGGAQGGHEKLLRASSEVVPTRSRYGAGKAGRQSRPLRSRSKCQAPFSASHPCRKRNRGIARSYAY